MQICNKGPGCFICKDVIDDQCKECKITAEDMGHAEFMEHMMSVCDINKPMMRVSG